jgi:hypothetical protein
VKTAYKSVNKEFGLMMSTLLPESFARLVPVTSEERLADGVNVNIKFYLHILPINHSYTYNTFVQIRSTSNWEEFGRSL